MGVVLISMLLAACASSQQQSIDADKQSKLAHIHYQLGVDALGKEGMLPKAFVELMESNAIRANQPHVLDALAYAWLLRGDFKRSEAYYLKALKYGAAANIYNNYANLLNRTQRFQAAETYARKALDDPRYPNQDMAFINLGNALSGQKKFLPAMQAFQQAKLFNASNLLADFRLADVYAQQGKLHEARALYQMVVAQQPDNRNGVEALLVVLHQQHDSRQAQIILQQFHRQTSSALDKAWALSELDKLDDLGGQPSRR